MCSIWTSSLNGVSSLSTSSILLGNCFSSHGLHCEVLYHIIMVQMICAQFVLMVALAIAGVSL